MTTNLELGYWSDWHYGPWRWMTEGGDKDRGDGVLAATDRRNVVSRLSYCRSAVNPFGG